MIHETYGADLEWGLFLAQLRQEVYAAWRAKGWHPHPERYYPASLSFTADTLETMRLLALDVVCARLKELRLLSLYDAKIAADFTARFSHEKEPSTQVTIRLVPSRGRATTYV